jgi:hypothetical protein
VEGRDSRERSREDSRERQGVGTERVGKGREKRVREEETESMEKRAK